PPQPPQRPQLPRPPPPLPRAAPPPLVPPGLERSVRHLPLLRPGLPGLLLLVPAGRHLLPDRLRAVWDVRLPGITPPRAPPPCPRVSTRGHRHAHLARFLGAKPAKTAPERRGIKPACRALVRCGPTRP